MFRRRAADKTSKYKPENSALKLKVGTGLNAEFARLADAYFAEIEAQSV
jgi:hypothetical protein